MNKEQQDCPVFAQKGADARRSARDKIAETTTREIPARQVHLDFHTSPLIPGVGARFDRAQFQKCLREGAVNSITVFAKCHHGYCYYPTKVGTPHPTMPAGMDLTGEMMKACHEIGVAMPVYITAGWSALDADEHPEWLERDKDGSARTVNYDLNAAPDAPKPNTSWKTLCLNGPYAEHIYALTQEIVDRYEELDGLFFDICFMGSTCYCQACRAGMQEMGLNEDDCADAQKYYHLKRYEFMTRTARILKEKHPRATIFFNGGADIRKPEYLPYHTHLEMEDLPTTWGGYNKMQPRASLMARTGKEILGMTGKFHTAWGEFGGYKNPNALRYEVMLMAMNGAKCSVGDQLPPSGRMDEETYKGIGVAYRALRELEPWAYPSYSTADVAVYLSGDSDADDGLHTMLLEAHIDFEVVLEGDDLSRFKLVILPDCVKISPSEAQRLQAYADQGGCVIFGGASALHNGKFLLDCGAEFVSDAIFDNDYLKVGDSLTLPYGNAPFLCYRAAKRLRLTDGERLAELYDPYFSRTYAHYCSHMNTPYKDSPADSPAIVRKGNVIYYAHPLCGMYKVDGAQLFREVMVNMVRQLYEPLYEVGLPSAGRTCLRRQEEEKRFVFHLAYANPMRRGRAEVIEDIVPMFNVPVSIRMERKPARVMLVPEKKEIAFDWKKGRLSFTVPCVNCHQAVEIDE